MDRKFTLPQLWTQTGPNTFTQNLHFEWKLSIKYEKLHQHTKHSEKTIQSGKASEI